MSKVIIITETDDEYGYDIFVDVCDSPETALKLCTEIWENSRGETLVSPLVLNENKTQIGDSKDGKFWSTIFYLEELDVKCLN